MKSSSRTDMNRSNQVNKTIAPFVKSFLLVCLLATTMNSLFAQNKFPTTGAAGIGTTTPNASSLLEIVSTSKGILIPRMTASQRNNIIAPATGLLVFVTDRAPGFYYYNGAAWVALAGSGAGSWANTSLSNLAATSINQPLLPITTNMINLGSASVRWNTLYAKSGDFAADVNIAGDVYKGTERVLAFTAGSTSIGEEAFATPTTTLYSTAIGFNALHSNTKGIFNTAVGYSALKSHTNGANCTAFGSSALQIDTSGFDNTAIGASALMLNTNGTGNTALGTSALAYNTTGTINTATGVSALLSNTTGYENTANGVLALASNQTGKGNVAVGSNALINGNTSYTVAVGDYALEQVKTGVQNVAIGSKAGNQTTGSYNSYLGYQAGFYDTASDNTAIGNLAGWTVANGIGCTYLGANAGPTTAGLTNATGIGYNVTPTASNQVRIGSSAVTSIGGQVSWSSLSDGRFKKNIKDNVPGLAFINLLKPVTYTFDFASLKKFKSEDVKEAGVKANAEASLADKVIHTGFVAQEVEAVAKKMNYDFDGVDAPKNEKDAYGIRYAEFVVPLVKAVQELSKKNDELEERISKLEAAMSSKTTTASIAQTSLKSISNSAAFLEQNTPNPSANTTSIRYTLPQQYSKAQLLVMDNEGRMIQSIPLTNSKGSVQVDVSKLSAGSYRYSLLVDNTMVASKQMIVAK